MLFRSEVTGDCLGVALDAAPGASPLLFTGRGSGLAGAGRGVPCVWERYYPDAIASAERGLAQARAYLEGARAADAAGIERARRALADPSADDGAALSLGRLAVESGTAEEVVRRAGEGVAEWRALDEAVRAPPAGPLDGARVTLVWFFFEGGRRTIARSAGGVVVGRRGGVLCVAADGAADLHAFDEGGEPAPRRDRGGAHALWEFWLPRQLARAARAHREAEAAVHAAREAVAGLESWRRDLPPEGGGLLAALALAYDAAPREALRAALSGAPWGAVSLLAARLSLLGPTEPPEDDAARLAALLDESRRVGQRLAHVGLVGRQKEVGLERLEVAPGRLAPREAAALDRQSVVLG